MSFCIRSGDVRDVDAMDIDRALCGDCEKPLVWASDRIADCCGYRYAYWTSTASCHRVEKAKVLKNISEGRGEP